MAESVVPTGTFEDLVAIMARLRAPDGCPWDREQTHDSLLRYLIEESAEVVEAVGTGDKEHLCEELGDVLLQVVFHARIAEDGRHFTISDVVRGISEKMVRRHPHVFGETSATTSDQVLVQWDAIKATEKKGQPREASNLDKVSKSLPALARAGGLHAKASKVGFEWPDDESAFGKVKEELDEFRTEMEQRNGQRLQEEFGDLLFSMVVLGRRFGIDAETAMIQANSKFERRFRALESLAGGADAVKSLNNDEWKDLWNRVKIR